MFAYSIEIKHKSTVNMFAQKKKKKKLGSLDKMIQSPGNRKSE